mgnify:CR=1 FL=1
MRIRVWGSRGSIPVSGREYLRYGGDTTCLEIRTKSDDIFIVDAGTGIRRLGNLLIEDQHYTYHFLITHGHWDHLMGLPFFDQQSVEQVTGGETGDGRRREGDDPEAAVLSAESVAAG